VLVDYDRNTLENPSARREHWRIRPVIDGTTEGTLGRGVYSHPDISLDGSSLGIKIAPMSPSDIGAIQMGGIGLEPTTSCVSSRRSSQLS
jgi:hypothetical protein